MKAIIFISSIFYILGLKFGNKIEIVKKSNPVEKIISNCISASKPSKAILIEPKDFEKAETDSIKGGGGEHEELILNDK